MRRWEQEAEGTRASPKRDAPRTGGIVAGARAAWAATRRKREDGEADEAVGDSRRIRSGRLDRDEKGRGSGGGGGGGGGLESGACLPAVGDYLFIYTRRSWPVCQKYPDQRPI